MFKTCHPVFKTCHLYSKHATLYLKHATLYSKHGTLIQNMPPVFKTCHPVFKTCHPVCKTCHPVIKSLTWTESRPQMSKGQLMSILTPQINGSILKKKNVKSCENYRKERGFKASKNNLKLF